MDVINCTIAENDLAEFGGGIEVGMGTVHLLNTLLSNNDAENLAGESIISQGYNLSSDDSVLLDGPSDLINTDPLLGPLQDNGGPTWTHALLPGSPALDAGTTEGAPETDQRGSIRPFGEGVDIGAFEFFADVWLKSPTVGGTYVIGEEVEIEWVTHVPTAGTGVRFELWRGDDFTASLNDGWNPTGIGRDKVTIPDVTQSDDYTFRVISAWNPSLFAESPAPFTITDTESSVSYDLWSLYGI